MTFDYHHKRCQEFHILKMDTSSYEQNVEFVRKIACRLVKEYTYEFLHGTMKEVIYSALRQIDEQLCDCANCRTASEIGLQDISGMFRCEELNMITLSSGFQGFSNNPWSTRVPGRVFENRFVFIMKILEKKSIVLFSGHEFSRWPSMMTLETSR